MEPPTRKKESNVQKRHFDKAALLVKAIPESQRWLVAQAFAVLFGEFNPRFDRARFFVACGLEVQS